MAQTTPDVPRAYLPDGDIHGAQREGARPRARLGTRAIRQLHFEGAAIAGLVHQLETTWNTVWSHIKPCLQAASDYPARFTRVQVLGGAMSTCDTTRTDADMAHSSSPASWTSHAGRIIPRTACWIWSREGLAPCTRTGRPSAEKTSARGCESRRWTLPGKARTPSLGLLQDAISVLDAFPSSSSPVMPLMRCTVASSEERWVTAGAQALPCVKSTIFCTPHATISPHANKNNSAQPSRQMRPI